MDQALSACKIQFQETWSLCLHLDVPDQSRSIRAGHGDQTKIGHLHQPARAREARRHAHCKDQIPIATPLILLGTISVRNDSSMRDGAGHSGQLPEGGVLVR